MHWVISLQEDKWTYVCLISTRLQNSSFGRSKSAARCCLRLWLNLHGWNCYKWMMQLFLETKCRQNVTRVVQFSKSPHHYLALSCVKAYCENNNAPKQMIIPEDLWLQSIICIHHCNNATYMIWANLAGMVQHYLLYILAKLYCSQTALDCNAVMIWFMGRYWNDQQYVNCYNPDLYFSYFFSS